MTGDILERLHALQERFLDEKFRLNQLQVDVPYYVFPYEPSDELIVRQFISKLVDKESKPYEVIEFNFYQELIRYLKERNFLEKTQSFEKRGMDQVITKLSRLLKLDSPQNIFTDEIMNRIDANEQQIILLTGIGDVFPLVRSHNVMNSLASRTQEKPVVLMFPGEFENGYLKTFNELQDENFYRAIRLF